MKKDYFGIIVLVVFFVVIFISSLLIVDARMSNIEDITVPEEGNVSTVIDDTAYFHTGMALDSISTESTMFVDTLEVKNLKLSDGGTESSIERGGGMDYVEIYKDGIYFHLWLFGVLYLFNLVGCIAYHLFCFVNDKEDTSIPWLSWYEKDQDPVWFYLAFILFLPLFTFCIVFIWPLVYVGSFVVGSALGARYIVRMKKKIDKLTGE